ncbi:MAG: Eco57I restriction-modification methylase domain-containing protein [Elainella sp.]
MTFNADKAQDYLYEFKLQDLFVQELGWANPKNPRPEGLEVEGQQYQRTAIAEMSGVLVFEITAFDGEIPDAETRGAIYRAISERVAENLLIFVNQNRTRSLWYWAKREGAKFYPRTETYVQGQPPDLLLSKIGGLYVPLEALEAGELPVIEIAARLQQSFDVEKVTKKFYEEFQAQHQIFLQQISGIARESDQRWYASVLLNRLMFVYFLQKKYFIDGGNLFYLKQKLEASRQRGKDLFYKEFLQTLFFDGFAKPHRSDAVKAAIGEVPYLNGGLFLQHQIELDERNQITIPDAAFEQVFAVFEKYSWHLDDRPGGKPNEINPDVLGYIFEKYINQKAFGAYYTRAEITEYLCDRTINKLILDRVNRISQRQFDSVGDLLVKLDAQLCRALIYGDDAILKTLSLLDPACGSGAFLIAAMKTLIPIYSGVIGAIKLTGDRQLTQWLAQVEAEHPSLSYFIKKRIITDNLYGVDIMEEAMEIAKLRLFLALVSSAQTADQLEPLPNVDFNIMAGNSLIGLMRVDAEGFDAVSLTGKAKSRGVKQEQADLQMSLLQLEAANSYRTILEEKNQSIAKYKEHSFKPGELEGTEQVDRLQWLRDHIDRVNEDSEAKLNQLLLSEFQKLKIFYEEAQLTGRPKKRPLTLKDIEALKPFHWGYHFDRVMARGGFDAIIANPPWEVFKPNAREFFIQHNKLVSKSKMDIKQFEKEQEKLLTDPKIAGAWLAYQSQFPCVSIYYRSAEQYKNQISIVNGKKAGTDINLYKLFLEQCFNLLRSEGDCGIILPTGIYTDLGAKQLREMLFSRTKITDLFGLSNERFIFDAVDHRFKICLVTFEKGGKTEAFQSAFRIDPREAIRPENLAIFLNDRSEHIEISVPLIRKLSPDSLSVMEFKSDADIAIAQKMLKFPLLGEKLPDRWNLKLTREFDRGTDNKLFQLEATDETLSLFVGKMFNQFTLTIAFLSLIQYNLYNSVRFAYHPNETLFPRLASEGCRDL